MATKINERIQHFEEKIYQPFLDSFIPYLGSISFDESWETTGPPGSVLLAITCDKVIDDGRAVYTVKRNGETACKIELNLTE